MTLEEELKTLIVEKYKSIRQFANEVNMPATTIQSMLNSGIENAGVKKVMRICDVLGIDTDALADGYIEEKKINPVDITVFEYDYIKKYRKLDAVDKQAVDGLLNTLSSRREIKEFIVLEPSLMVPYYGHVASAGTGQYIFDDIPPEMIEIENTMENMQANFAIGVNGNSMEPTYKDGDTLLVKKQPKIKIGEIGIFMVNGEAYVKELGNGVLISHNKDYEDISIDETTICIGYVLGKI